jgi:predicted nucleotidyltransferase
MDRHRAIEILRRHEPELRDLGIEHLSVFGSIARDGGTEDSDVDIAVRLKPGPRGFRRLERLEAVQTRLSELLSRPIDVIEEPARSPQVQRAIEREGVPAF